jgi:hypothetical protein
MEWLGHSSPEITLRFYAHVDKTSKTAIASAINRADAYFENNAVLWQFRFQVQIGRKRQFTKSMRKNFNGI